MIAVNNSVASYIFKGTESGMDEDKANHLDTFYDVLNFKSVDINTSYNFLSVLGDAVSYGIVTDTMETAGHFESNFAVNLLLGDDGFEPDLSGDGNVQIPGNFLVADVGENSKVHFGSSNPTSYLIINKDVSDRTDFGGNSKDNVVIAKTSKEKISSAVNGMISHMKSVSRNLLALDTIPFAGAGTNCLNIDTTMYPENAVICIDGDNYRKAIATGADGSSQGVNIKCLDSQLIVFNFDDEYSVDDPVTIGVVNVNGKDSTTTPGGFNNQNNNDADYVSQHVVWNLATVKNVRLDKSGGIYLVPDTESKLGLDGPPCGWIVSAGYSKIGGIEFHFVYQGLTNNNHVNLLLAKTVDNKKPTESQKFTFTVEQYIEGRFQPVKVYDEETSERINYTVENAGSSIIIPVTELIEGRNVIRIKEAEKTGYKPNNQEFYAIFDVTVIKDGDVEIKLPGAITYYKKFERGEGREKITSTPTFNNEYDENAGFIDLTKTIKGDVTEEDLSGLKFTVKRGNEVVAELKLGEDFNDDDSDGTWTLNEPLRVAPGRNYTVIETLTTTDGFDVEVTYAIAAEGSEQPVEGEGETTSAFEVKKDQTVNVAYENDYTLIPVSFNIPVRKNLVDETNQRQLVEGEFSFKLVGSGDAAGTERSASNDAKGEADFDVFTFDKPGTYVYTVTENKGTDKEITYSSDVYVVTIVIERKYDGSGLNIKNITYTKNDAEYDNEVLVFDNTYKKIEETVTITAQKKWVDYTGAELKTIPAGAKVTFALYIDGEVSGQTIVLDGKTDENGETTEWIANFGAQPKNNFAGNPISYSVEETVEFPGFEKTNGRPVVYNAENGIVIINKQKVNPLSVKKRWVDNNNQDGLRPENIVMTLSNGTAGEEQKVTLNEANNWTATVENLPTHKNGEKITYTWSEGTMPKGYSQTDVSYDGNLTIFENSYNPATTSLTVKKVWDDNNNQDGIRPDVVVVKLFADGVDTETILELSESTGWTRTISNLPVKKDGVDIVYTWQETVPAGYEVTSSTDGSVTTLTNKHVPETVDVTAVKAWKNADGTTAAPYGANVVFTLFADGEEVSGKSVTLDGTVDEKGEADAWTASFTGLPKNYQGTEINYTVKETTAFSGYTADKDSVKSGETITNTQDTGSLKITKVLSGDVTAEEAEGGLKFTIKNSEGKFLKADGTLTDSAEEGTLTLKDFATSDKKTYTLEFTGNKALAVDTYTVTETNSAIEGYTESVSYSLNESDKADGKGKDIAVKVEKNDTDVLVIEDNYTRNKGTIVLTKTIKGDVTAEEAAGALSFIIECADEGKEGTYLMKDGTTTTDAAAAKITLEGIKPDANGKYVIEIDSVPTGNYTVTEQTYTVGGCAVTVKHALNGADQATGDSAAFGVANNTTTTVDFENDYTKDTGSLKITKVLSGDVTAEEAEGGLKFTIKNSAGKFLKADGTLTDSAEEGTLTLKDFTTSDKKTYTLEFSGDKALAVDTYTVTETNSAIEGYTESVSYSLNESDKADGKGKDIAVKVEKNDTDVLVIEDNYTRNKGTIVLTKTIKGHLTPEEIAGALSFLIELKDKAGTYLKADGTTTDKADEAKIILVGIEPDANGKYVIEIDNVPTGDYTITEQTYTSEGYAVTVKYSLNGEKAVTGDNAQASVTKDNTVTVDFENDYTKDTGSLTITKKLSGDVTPEEAAGGITFTVMNSRGQYLDKDGKLSDSEVVLTLADFSQSDDKKTYTLSFTGDKALGTDTYTVTETNSAVTGYTESVSYKLNDDAEKEGKTVSVKVEKNDTDVLVIEDAYTFEKTSASWQKQWQNAEGTTITAPEGASAVIQLYADGVAVEGKTITLDGTADTDGESAAWIATFAELPKYKHDKDNKLAAIVYTADESQGFAGYAKTNNDPVAVNAVIVNKKTVKSLTVQKVWDDSNNKDGNRPESIVVTLSNGTVSENKTYTLNEANNWTVTVPDLPTHKNGSEINYSWTEGTMPEDYSQTAKTVNGNTTSFTNSYTPGKVAVTVEKVWTDDDNRDGVRPDEVSVKLLADGVETGKVVTLNAANSWTETVSGLDKKKNGADVVYTFEEVVPDGYTAAYSVNGTVTTITNTHDIELVDISAAKAWKNADGSTTAPNGANVEFALYADGNAVSGKTVTLDGNVDEDGEATAWTASFTNLPKNANGKAIVYTVKETAPYVGYTSDKEVVENGGTITNTEDTGSLVITKRLSGLVTPEEEAGGITFEITNSEGKYLDKNGKLNDKKVVLTLQDFVANSDKTEFTLSFTGDKVLSTDTYTVTETNSAIEGYTESVSYKLNDEDEKTGKIIDVKVEKNDTDKLIIDDKYTPDSSLVVIVTEEHSGKPVPDAEVEITKPDGTKETLKTDKDGKITLEEIPSGDYTVEVKKVPDDYDVTTGKKDTIIVPKGGEGKHEAVIATEKGALDVTVTEEDTHNPVPNAEVIIVRVNPDGTETPVLNKEGGTVFTTDENGKVSELTEKDEFDNYKLEPGEYKATVVKIPDGYKVTKGEVTEGTVVKNDVTHLEAEIIPTSELEVVVTEKKSGKPVPEAEVTITRKNPDGTTTVVKTEDGQDVFKTDENGKIDIKDIPAGKYEVEVKKVPDGYDVVTGQKDEVTVPRNSVGKHEAVIATEKGGLDVTVTEKKSGNPVPDAEVEIVRINEDGSETVIKTKDGKDVFTTDENGKITELTEKDEFDNYILEPGNYEARVKKVPDDYDVDEGKITKGTVVKDEIEHLEAKIVISTGGLDIQVVEEGGDERPVPGAKVKVVTPDGEEFILTTDEDGYIRKFSEKDEDGDYTAKTGEYKITVIEVPEGYKVTVGETKIETVERGRLKFHQAKIQKTSSNTDERTPDSPKTGDDNHMLMLMLLAAVSMAGMIVFRKKENEN